MNIIINGEDMNIEENKTLQNIILHLKIEEKVMASAVNMEIIKKDNWDNYILKENDKIELLQFVGGG